MKDNKPPMKNQSVMRGKKIGNAESETDGACGKTAMKIYGRREYR